MLYTLQNLYKDKVLNRNRIVTEDIEQNTTDDKKVLGILSAGLKMVLEMIDNPTSDETETLEKIRTEVMNTLIDAGIEKD